MLPLIYHPIYSQLPLPEGHRYPIMKYQYLYDEVQRRMAEQPKWREAIEFFAPTPVNRALLEQVHQPQYVASLLNGSLPVAKMRRIGFPWSDTLIERSLMSLGGTCLTVEQALVHGQAIHLSGGYHHAHYAYGSGFCLFNDLVVAAQHALTLDGIDTVLIIDSDVHHGDGSATLCADRSDIFTVSFHCDKNFPARKPASDMDVPLPRGCDDATFLTSFEQVAALALNLYRPDLVIYDAGVDIHQEDELGYLNISTEGIYQRDLWLFRTLRQRQIPVAAVVGGGYRSQHADLVPIHRQLIEAALTMA